MKNHKNKHKEHSHNEGNPDLQKIERRAHQFYRHRGGDHGRDIDDWLQAERELKELDQVARSH